MNDQSWSLARLAVYRERVNRELARFLARKRKHVAEMAPEALPYHDAMARFVLRGGKRIRPALVYWGYRLCGGGKEKERDVIRLSIATDLTHSFLLIHDDIMDRGTLRRGKPTLHIELAQMARRQHRPDADHLGMAQAILLGDFCSALAYEVVSSADFPQEIGHKVLSVYTEMLQEVEVGQVLDILYGAGDAVDEKEIHTVMEYKTARYTGLAPLRIGALLANATDEQLACITAFAPPMGRAFQIVDDVIGMLGTQKEIGKSNVSDLREGKKTLLIAKALKKADAAQKKRLLRALGDPEATREDLTAVRKILRKTGAADESIREANELIDHALKRVQEGPFEDAEAKRFLTGIGRFIVDRVS